MAVGPIDLKQSKYATLLPIPVDAVQLHDDFLEPRRVRNREVTIPAQLKHCEETGRLDNFRRAAGKIQGAFQGLYAFNDSDIYKWAEAASWSLATHPDPELDAQLDGVIQEVGDAQQPDGYLNTYFMFEKEPLRFANIKDLHEIYCAGHLFQAAVAHYRATGKTTFLDIAARLADLLDRTFGPEPEKRIGTCGHPEAEMALVELYRSTGEERYLKLARFMIDVRGRKPGIFNNNNYSQDHLPFVEQTEVTGHAVRHLYLLSGAADVVAETDAPEYRKAIEALWHNFTTRRIYVTGGAGGRHDLESFGNDYELPNERSYSETCAAIASVMWCWRMLNVTGEARFADLMELTLYNAVLPGISLDGTHYFYENPLADRGNHRRQEWFGCACCPPNIARLLASLPGYFYSTRGQDIYVHLYASGIATIPLPDGGSVTLEQRSNYPWDGDIEIRVKEVTGDPQYLYLRIPGWSNLTSPTPFPTPQVARSGSQPAGEGGVLQDSMSVKSIHAGVNIRVNGEVLPHYDLEGARPGSYFPISLRGGVGTTIRLTLPMEVKRLCSHPHVAENRGRVALQRGPIVYCIEAADNPGVDVWDVELPSNSELTAEHRPDLLGGVTVLRGRALVRDVPADLPLYMDSSADPLQVLPSREIELTAIPYCVWAHRDPGPMQVWIPY